ncbi:MAG: hypothetical protein IPL39_00535 [Opitutaceae bacterium]|nr:hypothetical protein [Opitutaceae bacterium]
MKLKVSIALNVVLTVVIAALVLHGLSATLGNYYYRKMVGVAVSGAAQELKRGHIDSVLGALSSIPGDPSDGDILAAGTKLGVVQ